MNDELPNQHAQLSAPYVLEYGYTRTVGAVMGRFFAGLRDGRILGGRTASGTVIVPPTEYDPDTGESLEDLVEVGQRGEVMTWTWIDHPRLHQPLDRPFAWALIQLEGATTSMLHVVDAGSPDRMRTGMRVRVRWRAHRAGEIRDIECFEPEDAR